MNILVTGATSGIGYALVELLAAKGHQLVATGRNEEKLAELSALTNCHTIVADLVDPAQAVSMFEQACQKLGQLDVLVNNAGMNTRKCPVEEFTLDEFEQQYAINLRAPALLSREALRVMKAVKSGYIINVVSTVAKRSNETMSVYTAMKQGFAGFSAVLMKEAQPHGIKVSTLFPGGTDTNFREAERPQYMSAESVAKTINCILELPEDIVMHDMTFRPAVELE